MHKDHPDNCGGGFPTVYICHVSLNGALKIGETYCMQIILR